METVEKAKTYPPPEAVRNTAKRFLKLREKYKRGGLSTQEAGAQGIGSGIARARDLASGDNISLETIKRMSAFFSRHEKNYRPDVKESDGGPTAGTMAWWAWGGSSGKAWARSILRQEGLLKSVDKVLQQSESTAIIKSTEEEMKLATFVVLVPDEVDLHGDIYDELTVLKACNNYNKYCRKSNLFHLQQTESFSVVQSWTSPVDTEIEGRPIKKGTWLCTVECHSDELWKLIKSGDICSVSIGASALTEYLNDEE